MACTIGLSACETIKLPLPNMLGSAGHKVMLADGIEFTLPRTPWSKDEPVDVIQQVQAQWNPGSQTEIAIFEGRLNIQQDQAKIVLIDKLGRRAIAIDWNGQKISIQKANWLPEEFDPRRLLADIVMTYWPIDVVADALPDNMSIHDSFGERVIRLNDSGRQYATIERPIKDIWQGQATLENLKYNYRIQINSIRTGS